MKQKHGNWMPSSSKQEEEEVEQQEDIEAADPAWGGLNGRSERRLGFEAMASA